MLTIIDDAYVQGTPATTPEESADTSPAEQPGLEKMVVKLTDYPTFVANLDLHGSSIRRTSMRHTSNPKLSRWQLLASCRGIQIYEGFDDMPLTAALEEGNGNDDGQGSEGEIRIVTAGW